MRTFLIGIAFLLIEYYKVPVPYPATIIMLLAGGVMSIMQDVKELLKDY